MEKPPGGGGDILDGELELRLVGGGGDAVTADLADELERRCVEVVRRGRWLGAA
jgi:hypothetical protein